MTFLCLMCDKMAERFCGSCGLQVTDGLGHGIELEAHLTGQRDLLCLVFPGGEKKKAPFGAGLVILMSRVRKLIETPRGEEDEG